MVSCPKVVKDYNSHMGGVDKHDQLRQYYHVDRRSVKWWYRIAFGLLDSAVINAYKWKRPLLIILLQFLNIEDLWHKAYCLIQQNPNRLSITIVNKPTQFQTQLDYLIVVFTRLKFRKKRVGAKNVVEIK